jgi:hypothetical protein
MYFPRNREFGSALSKLQNFGGGGGLNPQTHPRYATALHHFFSPFVKSRLKYQAGLKADHWSAFNTDVKNAWICTYTPPLSSWGTQGHISFNYLAGMQKTMKELKIVCLLPRLKLGTFQLKVTGVTPSTDVVGIAVRCLPRTQN